MANTKHAEDWMFYHDALSIMKAKETKEWMKRKGYFEKWILPLDDIFMNYTRLKAKFGSNPLGNSPEFMPWDAYLNRDIHSSLDYHCLISKPMNDNDPKKFSASTPKKMFHAYKRILDPGPSGVCPPSRRIIQDIRRTILSFHMVVAAEGCMIEDSPTRRGIRYDNTGGTNNNWGGKRTKSHHSKYLPPEGELHEDLAEERQAQMLASINNDAENSDTTSTGNNQNGENN